MIWCLNMVLCKRIGWDSVLNLLCDCVIELFFWKKNLGNLLSFKIIWFKKILLKMLFFDVSEFVVVGYFIE